MKKFIALLLVIMMAFALVSCGGNKEPASESDTPATTEEELPTAEEKLVAADAEEQEPSYEIVLTETETDEDTGLDIEFYDVKISANPDWAEDDWWYHSTYAEKIVREVLESSQTGNIWISGYVDGLSLQVFSYENIGINKNNAIILYNWHGDAQTGNPVEYLFN
ncbi:MAG: hypothetical protein LBQ21_07615 [Clostridiales Family XIII bacterium]|jgi:hypothetical protein|nr:hypothetical protein [Clostridiales Family XIII bacterium]